MPPFLLSRETIAGLNMEAYKTKTRQLLGRYSPEFAALPPSDQDAFMEVQLSEARRFNLKTTKANAAVAMAMWFLVLERMEDAPTAAAILRQPWSEPLRTDLLLDEISAELERRTLQTEER